MPDTLLQNSCFHISSSLWKLSDYCTQFKMELGSSGLISGKWSALQQLGNKAFHPMERLQCCAEDIWWMNSSLQITLQWVKEPLSLSALNRGWKLEWKSNDSLIYCGIVRGTHTLRLGRPEFEVSPTRAWCGWSIEFQFPAMH